MPEQPELQGQQERRELPVPQEQQEQQELPGGWAPAAAWWESCAVRWGAPEPQDEPEQQALRVRQGLQDEPVQKGPTAQ